MMMMMNIMNMNLKIKNKNFLFKINISKFIFKKIFKLFNNFNNIYYFEKKLLLKKHRLLK